ncbi:lactonase family protein [Sphingomonas endolithica]|uniref:lactonase family protein n=1 Tax=Sphingomonas endolithica TaxID=2972485 RepID=UPI0021AFE294|nr:lactonase family protein [Sphingomonas sp. ZFBP2030]
MYALRQRADGDLALGSVYPHAANASFSVYSARHDIHYLVDENAGSVGAYRHRGGRWEMLATIPTQGAAPCHIALNPAETLLAVANYASGSVSLFRLDMHDGLPRERARVHANHGSGPDAQRQDRPHAHWVGFSADGRWLYQADLGTDEILAFAIDGAGDLRAAQRSYQAPPGSGPRHLLLHPHLTGKVYLASELASTLTVLDHADGKFHNPLIMSTLPADWQGDTIVAHVAINQAGTRLYVSNRGHDSIAVFAIGDDAIPTLLQHARAGGAFPRFFLLLEDQALMLVANEKGQTVSTLVIDGDGCLSPTGTELSIPGVCYLLIPASAKGENRD